LLLGLCNEYKRCEADRLEGRAQFWLLHPWKRGRRAPNFLAHLSELPSFAV
jgi:hypothetical protein